jgi:ADP-ribose diphosphatase
MKKINEKILYEGNWLTLNESVFYNENGVEVKWETVSRKNYSLILIVVAKLMPSERFVILKQFRQSIDGYVLGFPAGLTDLNPGDEKLMETEALRELEEETGYTGKIISKSPKIKANSGMSDLEMEVYIAHIDENLEINKNPKQKLETSEEIEVFLLKKEEIKPFLTKMQKNGVNIGAGIWYMFGIL